MSHCAACGLAESNTDLAQQGLKTGRTAENTITTLQGLSKGKMCFLGEQVGKDGSSKRRAKQFSWKSKKMALK